MSKTDEWEIQRDVDIASNGGKSSDYPDKTWSRDGETLRDGNDDADYDEKGGN